MAAPTSSLVVMLN